ncbi:MAG: RNA-binding S4 domain-containing protein [Promicromonosporaceae bacterium]|nr:RNA-binding S4 domain-containing protein [Promicromonosporaceae bacterium]
MTIEAIPIREETIRLGQFLKYAGLAESGAEARQLIEEGEVSVGGQVELRRGRQLRAGDVVVVQTPGGTVGAEVGEPLK